MSASEVGWFLPVDCIEILRSPPYSLPGKQIPLRSGKPSARAMLDLATLNHFSRCNCVAICAALIPVNLLISTAVIVLSALDRSPQKRQRLAILGLFPALLLISHVASWWIVGVVAPASFLLPSIALLCTIINWLCLWKPAIVQQQYGVLRNRWAARTQVPG
jgi:hypothetical protein